MAIDISVVCIPGAVSSLVLEDGATVAQALEVAGQSPAGYSINVAGLPASLDTVLSNGQRVTLTREVKAA